MENDRRNTGDQICSAWETQRRKALQAGFEIVARHKKNLTEQEANVLKTHLLSGFVQGEIMSQISERLSESKIAKTFTHPQEKK